MKYIKPFKHNKEEKLIKDFLKNINKLVKHVYTNENIQSEIINNKILFKSNSNNFLSFTLNYNTEENYFNIKLEQQYTNSEIYEKTTNFQNYFTSITNPLTFDIDKKVKFKTSILNFNIFETEFKTLISTLSTEEYNVRTNKK